jgi:hypothetical protein
MRQLRQPTKDALRAQLALAADEIIRLRSDVKAARPVGYATAPYIQPRPWWIRLRDWWRA